MSLKALKTYLFQDNETRLLAEAVQEFAVQFEQSDWLDWVPRIQGRGSLTWSNPREDHARYRISGNTCDFYFRVTGDLGGSADNDVDITLPVPFSQASKNFNSPVLGSGWLLDSSGAAGVVGCYGFAATDQELGDVVTVRDYKNTNFGTSSTLIVAFRGSYEIEPRRGVF